MRDLLPTPLTAQAFAPFGDLVSIEAASARAANQGSAQRADFTAALTNTRPAARANVAVFRSQPRALPFEIALLERHPCSTQLFSPLSVSRYVVVVAPEEGSGGPREGEVQAFLATPLQAVNYRAGTWHHPLLVLDREAQFLMLAWEDGTALDCEEHRLVRPWTLVETPEPGAAGR